MAEQRAYLLAAGGTGGHLFPAEALALALIARGAAVELVTDDRALRYGKAFPARAIHTLPSATPTAGSMITKVLAGATLVRGTLAARRLLRRLQPLAVVGFGGYPTVPPLLAATQLGVVSILHEQNTVMGRANRFLARRVDLITTGFATITGIDAATRAKVRHVGNPVRPAVIEAARMAYPAAADGRLHLLVTGGSQGARVMSDIVPAAVELLSAADRARLVIVQQARGEDEARVRAAYERLGVDALVASFFSDLPARMAAAELVVARAGASTIAELGVIGRAAILVPLPGALDQDQAHNAAEFALTGAAEVVAQPDFSPARLADSLRQALADPAALNAKAQAAKSTGIADAAERLADLVMSAASQKQNTEKEEIAA